jgi:hypothetical protein
MATNTSSLLGVDLSASNSTALFALRTPVNTTGGGYFEYCEFSATQITGRLVLITNDGTAYTLLTSKLTAASATTGIGYDIGAVQNVVNQGEFGWVARKGANLYVSITGTCTAGGDIAYAAAGGKVQNAVDAAVGLTSLGIWITTSDSAQSLVKATLATLLWPTTIIHS